MQAMFVLDEPGDKNKPKFFFFFDYKNPDLVNKMLQGLWPTGGDFLAKIFKVSSISVTFSTAEAKDLKDWTANIFTDWKGTNNVPMGLTVSVKAKFSDALDYPAIEWLRSKAPGDLYVDT